jgi:molybdopterin molybdotransferase
MVTFVLFVAPALAALTGAGGGAGALATLDSDYEKRAGRAHAVRCRVEARADGLYATPTGPQGSHILTSMLAADALAIIPSARESVRRGERVRLLALPGGEMPSGAAAVSPGSEAAAWTTT